MAPIQLSCFIFATFKLIWKIEFLNQDFPPSQPYQEDIVEFEFEIGPTANPDSLGHNPSQEYDLDFINCQISQNTQKNLKNMPFNSTPHRNILSTRASDAHAATAKILQEKSPSNFIRY